MRSQRPDETLADTGCKGYREAHEAPDGRPVIYYPHPFWQDETERLTYEHAAESRPRGEQEGAISYVRRLAESVQRRMLAPPVKSMRGGTLDEERI